MKLILNLLITVIFSIIIYSCDDSLGIDSKVQKFPVILEDSSLNDSSEKQFSIRETKFYIKEISLIKNTRKTFNWETNSSKKTDIRLDTSWRKTRFWMNLEFESPFANQVLKDRQDRINSFQIKIKGFLEDLLQNIPLDGASDSGRWLSLIVQTNTDRINPFKIYSMTEVTSNLYIKSFNKENGEIEGIITVDLTNIVDMETEKLECSFVLIFK